MSLSMISSPRRFVDTIDAPASITIVDGSIPPIELADFYINSATNNIWLCVNSGSVVASTQSGLVWKQMRINIASGTVTLALGIATVLTPLVALGSKITLSSTGPNGTVGNWKVSAIVPGVSFTIVSSTALDTSTIYWEIF
jgi:hypothetical protein